MQIFIKSLCGKTIIINVESSESIETLKSKIQEKEGIPVEYQILISSNRVLANKKPISFYNIKSELNINLSLKLKSGIQIKIKTLEKEITFNVGPHTTIKDIKDEIKKQQFFFKLNLVFNGRILEDKKSVTDYNIKNGSIIYSSDKVLDIFKNKLLKLWLFLELMNNDVKYIY